MGTLPHSTEIKSTQKYITKQTRKKTSNCRELVRPDTASRIYWGWLWCAGSSAFRCKSTCPASRCAWAWISTRRGFPCRSWKRASCPPKTDESSSPSSTSANKDSNLILTCLLAPVEIHIKLSFLLSTRKSLISFVEIQMLLSNVIIYILIKLPRGPGYRKLLTIANNTQDKRKVSNCGSRDAEGLPGKVLDGFYCNSVAI